MEEQQIYCDGGARGNPGPAACAFVVKNESGEIIYSYGKYLGETTNNQAEYGAVIEALTWLSENQSEQEILFFLDSQLVVNQINGVYKIKEKSLQEKNILIKKLINDYKIKIKSFTYIPREKNFLADRLVNETLDKIQA